MRGALLVSALVSSVVILLIIGFLFKEGFGLFGKSPVEEGLVVLVHPASGVESVTPEQVRGLMDQTLVDLSEVGGDPFRVTPLDYDDLDDDQESLVALIADTPGGIGAVFEEDLEEPHGPVTLLQVDAVSLRSFFTGKAWYPTAEPVAQLGILALILGSLMVTVGAIAIALPVGLAAAVYISEIADPKVKNLLKPVIEILAGIPSVVYGFFGLVVLVPRLQSAFNLQVGETALAGMIMLAIMALPTVISVSEYSLAAVPRAYREGSLALGATRGETILKVVIPSAFSGISAAAMLGVGRAVGETMTVLMVTGNAAQIPTTFLQPVRTLTATITAELGVGPIGGTHHEPLFAIAITLFVMTFVINLIADLVQSRVREA